MQTSQNNGPNPLSDARQAMHWAVLLITAYSTSVEVFLRKGMGPRYLGWQAVGVLLLVPAHTYLMPDFPVDGLLLFLALYLLACVVQRIGMVIDHWRGVVVHSRYNGRPRLMSSNCGMDEPTFKTWVDPFVVGVVGVAVWDSVDRLLGIYLLIATVALHLQGRLCALYETTEQLDLRDAAIEQQQRADLFRRDGDGLLGALRGHSRHGRP
jgi:hypothetical protein